MFVDANMPASGSAAKEIVFGNFTAGLICHDAGIRVERSDDYAFNQDLVSFRILHRIDSVVRDVAALRTYQRTA